MNSDDELKRVRERIDQVDQQLIALISERAKLAQEVAAIKQSAGDKGPYYRPEREAQILRGILDNNPGPLNDEEMARLFREIMSACLALEQPMRIAYLGPEGTFTQAAAHKQFGHSVQTMPFGAIDEVFRDVEAGHCHFGVVPIENSTEGVVNHTLDMFVHSPLKICGEVELRIHHHLAGRQGQGLETVERVYSHQQSLAQCREWLDSRLPRANRIPVASNAEAARLVADEEGAAAICGETAAEIYGLEIISANIEDEPENTTRFLVIGRRSVAPSGNDKTSLLLSAPNRPGSLYELLEPFSGNEISMTKIESRPSRRGTWEYVFFVDIQGHAREPGVARALKAVGERAAVLKILGSYPKAAL
jgi:chorismate mutase/prephenate dehydratase